jgi:hypothetical protein
MGATWALWYALARPGRVRRLALLGSAPLLPGTRAPAPLRVMAAPIVGDLFPRLVKPSAKMVVRMMSSMGEGETIVRHPDLIDAMVAAGRDPIASATDLAELRAILTPLGFRRSLRVQPSELQHLTVPTLLIWGDHDPVGTVDVAQAVASLIPDAQLDVVAAGHAVWLGDPKRIQDSCARSRARTATDDTPDAEPIPPNPRSSRTDEPGLRSRLCGGESGDAATRSCRPRALLLGGEAPPAPLRPCSRWSTGSSHGENSRLSARRLGRSVVTPNEPVERDEEEGRCSPQSNEMPPCTPGAERGSRPLRY